MPTASSDRPLSDPIGPDFGPYKLVRRLGVGGMAETFEAIRTDLGKRVCVKVVLPFFRDQQDFQELFQREARLAAKLNHNNIVKVIEFGAIEGVTYMELELVDGVDLASLLAEQPGRRLSHEHVAFIGHELAAALAHAHDPRREGSASDQEDNAIIHRDLSPSNVLVSQNGEVKLTDFGVAKAITGTSNQQSAVKGKVPYMSPEQLKQESLDGSADLFALGVVLFEALSGEHPFQGDHDPATIMRIVEGKHASLHGLAPAAPPELCEAIELLLEPDRAKRRPKKAKALLEMLDDFIPSLKKCRELGAMASEVRAAKPDERPSGPPISGSELTELQPKYSGEASGVSRNSRPLVPEAEATRQEPAPRIAGKRPSRRALGWALSALVATILAITLWPVLRDDPQGEGTTSPEETAPTVAEDTAAEAPAGDAKPIPKATPEPESIEGAGDAASETASDEEPTPAVPTARPARLTVVVFPWGDVWINGKRRGAAPLKNVSLKPGRYKISAGQGTPSKTQIIRLGEAQRKTVEFDLTK